MAKLSCFIVALVALVALVNAENFCKRELCQYANGPHTMCIYPRAGESRQCYGYVKSPLTSQQKQEIVDEHNRYRRLVASGRQRGQPGGYIPDLHWDEELAVVAQRWADQCANGHDKCRNIEKYGYVGQNIAGGGSTAGFDREIKDLVKMWFDEVDDFNPALIRSYQSVGGPMIGHYTQLVWAKTTHVGCGLVKHKKTIEGTTYNWTTLICNYGPGGNIISQPIYQTR